MHQLCHLLCFSALLFQSIAENPELKPGSPHAAYNIGYYLTGAAIPFVALAICACCCAKDQETDRRLNYVDLETGSSVPQVCVSGRHRQEASGLKVQYNPRPVPPPILQLPHPAVDPRVFQFLRDEFGNNAKSPKPAPNIRIVCPATAPTLSPVLRDEFGNNAKSPKPAPNIQILCPATAPTLSPVPRDEFGNNANNAPYPDDMHTTNPVISNLPYPNIDDLQRDGIIGDMQNVAINITGAPYPAEDQNILPAPPPYTAQGPFGAGPNTTELPYPEIESPPPSYAEI